MASTQELQRHLGRVIAGRRVRQDLTQLQLADQAGISRHTIMRIEKGSRSADMAQLDAIAHVLRCSVSVLLVEAETMMRG